MTENEIIEKRQALTQNDIDHFNKRIAEIDKEILALKSKQRSLQQMIGKKQIFMNQLESDKDE